MDQNCDLYTERSETGWGGGGGGREVPREFGMID